MHVELAVVMAFSERRKRQWMRCTSHSTVFFLCVDSICDLRVRFLFNHECVCRWRKTLSLSLSWWRPWCFTGLRFGQCIQSLRRHCWFDGCLCLAQRRSSTCGSDDGRLWTTVAWSNVNCNSHVAVRCWFEPRCPHQMRTHLLISCLTESRSRIGQCTNSEPCATLVCPADTYDHLNLGSFATIEMMSRWIGMVIEAKSDPAKPNWTSAKYFRDGAQEGADIVTAWTCLGTRIMLECSPEGATAVAEGDGNSGRGGDCGRGRSDRRARSPSGHQCLRTWLPGSRWLALVFCAQGSGARAAYSRGSRDTCPLPRLHVRCKECEGMSRTVRRTKIRRSRHVSDCNETLATARVRTARALRSDVSSRVGLGLEGGARRSPVRGPLSFACCVVAAATSRSRPWASLPTAATLVGLLKNLFFCHVICEIIDAQARVALEGIQERMLCDPSECEERKIVDACCSTSDRTCQRLVR